MFSSAAVIVSYLTILTTVFGLNELFEAIMKGKEARVINLLEKSYIKTLLGRRVYDVNLPDCDLKRTPLEFAIQQRKENIAVILIKKGAVDRPLGKAIDVGMEKVVRLILEDANVDVNKEIVVFLYNEHQRASTTFLHEAIRSGKAAIVKMICDKGADVEKINSYNFTPLQSAIHSNAGTEIARILLEAGADVNGINSKLKTALHFAADYPKNKRLEVMNVLLSVESVDIEAVDNNGDTPLLTAASNSNVDCMRALLAAGANVHAKNNYQKTILHHIMSRGDEDTINLAKSYGFDFECRDQKGDTPFLYSARYEDVNAMRALAKAGANINVYDNENKGVMHYAVRAYEHPVEMVEISLFYAENSDFLNEIGQTLELRLLDRRREMGRLTRNKLLEAGLQLSREEYVEFLKDYWPPCDEIVKNGNFRSFQELFRKVTEKLLKNGVRKMTENDDEDLIGLLYEYEFKGAFALFKILKTIYAKKESATELEWRKFEIFDHAVEKIMEGSYLTTLPVELTSDILLCNAFYRWKLETMSFHLALAFEELNVSLDRVKRAMVEIIFNY